MRESLREQPGAKRGSALRRERRRQGRRNRQTEDPLRNRPQSRLRMMTKIPGRIFTRALHEIATASASGVLGTTPGSPGLEAASKDARNLSSAGGAHAFEDRAKSDSGNRHLLLPDGARSTVQGKDEPANEQSLGSGGLGKRRVSRRPPIEDQVVRAVPSRSGMEPSTTPRVDPVGGSEPIVGKGETLMATKEHKPRTRKRCS